MTKMAKGKPTSIYLEDDVRKFMDELAGSRGASRSEVLNAIVRRFMRWQYPDLSKMLKKEFSR